VLENVGQAERTKELEPHGRYGLGNINVDRNWIARDMVGIDAGSAVLALDNYLMNNRVCAVFHALPCVHRGLERLKFERAESAPALRQAS
jgi:hypothetical protein